MRPLRRGFGVAALVVLALGGVLAAVSGPASAGGRAEIPEDRRVLVLSLPGLTWDEVEHLPTIRSLLAESAVANVALRVQRLATRPGEGYATLGAGTRAVAGPAQAGFAFDREERYDEGTAADEFHRQTERVLTGDVAVLSWSRLEGDNSASEFDATLGTLGTALADAGWSRGVVANADGADLLAPTEPLHREAALAMADEDGVVPCGRVGRGLLVDDARAAFGVRLDRERVLEEADRCLVPRSMVLVEASDLRRAAVYGSRLEADASRRLWQRTLQEADAMVADLLGLLDDERDAVVVVAPAVTTVAPRLTTLGVRATEHDPGLLVSGSTRQDGYVTLADVTPTLAALAGAPLDEGEIEGRSVEVGARGGSADERLETLVDADSAARFRDRMLTPMATTYITVVGLIGLAAAYALWRGERAPRTLEAASLAALGFLPMTYLAGAFPFHEWGAAAYSAFVVGGACVLGAAYWALRGRWYLPLVLAYGVLVGVVAVSVTLLGSRLQLSTVFGDSPIVAGRFNGINNVTFAQVLIATAVIGIVLAHRLPLERARIAVPVLFGAVLLVVAAPMWGADVGGALAGLPAFALLAAGLGRWRVRWGAVVLWGAAAVLVVIALGLFDLTRDAADRSHLGRLLERISSDGFDGFATIVERKLSANLRSLTNSVWRFVLPPVLIGAAVVAWRAPGRLRDLMATLPELRRALPGLLVAALLGYAVNDSGIAVPAMMLAALVPGIVYLLVRRPDADAADTG